MTTTLLRKLGTILLISLVNVQFAHSLQFSSENRASDVVQLFTSEGCSSCPPAERWVSGMVEHPDLFKTLVPLAFHVDYWDRLGWDDPYAKRAFTQRQQRFKHQGLLSGVYTPGLIVNNNEFRQWFTGARRWTSNADEPGVLQAKYSNGNLAVQFASKQRLELHVAWLGIGIKNQVKRGENQGKTLRHDFVVLDHQKFAGKNQWLVPLASAPDLKQQRSALAVWVTPVDSEKIIQAAGAYFE